MKCKELFVLGWKNKFPYSSLLFEEGDNNGGNDGGGSDDNNDAGNNGGNDGVDDKPKYTDADLDRIIGERFSRWQKQHEKKVSEAAKLAGLSAEERADELQKRIDELEAEKAHNEMMATARSLFQNAEITTIPDNLVSMVVTTDAESTQKNVKAFIKMFNAAVKEAVKNQIGSKGPKVGGSGTLTKEEIMKEQNPIKRQKLIAENIALFKK